MEQEQITLMLNDAYGSEKRLVAPSWAGVVPKPSIFTIIHAMEKLCCLCWPTTNTISHSETTDPSQQLFQEYVP